MKRRLISFLLLIALVVTAMPLVAFAAEGEGSTTSTMTEAEYNALYVQDGLYIAFDAMPLNTYWGETADQRAVFPASSPMFNSSYPYAGTDYVTGEAKTIWDFTKKASITVTVDDGNGGQTEKTVEIPYYEDRFDPRARTDNTTGSLKTGLTEDKKYEYHIERGTRGEGGANGYTYFYNDQNKFIGTTNTYNSLEAAYEELLALEEADTNDLYDYFIVGDATSDAYKQAMRDYTNQVNAWIAKYTWNLEEDGVKTNYFYMSFNTDTYRMQVRDSFMAYAPVKVPEAGKGYLTVQYPYQSDSSLGFTTTFAIDRTNTMEIVTRIGAKATKNPFMFGNLRPQLSGTTFGSVSNLVADPNNVYTNTTETEGALDLNAIETFRFTLGISSTYSHSTYNTTTGAETAKYYRGNLLLEQGKNFSYAATGSLAVNSTNMLGYGDTLKDGEIYALRSYTRELSDSEKAQNKFADIAKWFKLDVADFAAIRDEYGPKALKKYYDAFADLTFASDRDYVQAVADEAYLDLSDDIVVYPEISLDDYNKLYVTSDLMLSLDFFELNKYWSPDGQHGYVVPTGVSDNDSYYDETTKKTFDFTVAENRFDYIVTKTAADGATSTVGTYLGKADADAAIEELNAAENDGATYTAAMSTDASGNGVLHAAWKRAVKAWWNADKAFFNNFNNTPDSAQVFSTANSSFDTHSTSSRHNYVRSAIDSLGDGYITLPKTGKMYAGGGLIMTGASKGAAKTLEMVSELGENLNTYYLLFNSLYAKISKNTADKTFKVIGNADANYVLFADALDGGYAPYDKVTTLTYEMSYAEDKKTGTFSMYNGSKTLLDAESFTVGASGIGEHHYIGFQNGMKEGKLYAVRYYSDALTAEERAQNHFADIAKFYRLDTAILESLTESETERVYGAFADYSVGEGSRALMQEVYEAILEEIAYEYVEGILEFDGYEAKISVMPGLRSTYSIDKKAIDIFEASGKKITVGAMMALATDEKTAHEDLVAPTLDKAYDRTGYGEGHSYVSGGVAYQEIYSGGEVVANLLSKSTEDVLKFAFTTTYSEANQTVKNFTTGLLYRGYVVIEDADGNTEKLIYADMTSDIFDTNGDAITIYDLSDYFYTTNAQNQGNNEQILKVVNTVDTSPNSYYSLYVQDGLIYNLNFAGAKATDTVVGSSSFDNENESASVRFVAAASNFLPYTAYRMAGVPDGYINGATSTILPGWKFATPYKYSWWFNEDGTATTSGTTGSNKDAVVTSELTEEELTALETLTGFKPTLYQTTTRAYDGVTETLHHYLYQSPGEITDYYIGNGIWAGRYYASAFGDDYINFGSGTAPYYAYSGASALVLANKKFTVETTMASTGKSTLSVFAGGVRFQLINSAAGITVSAPKDNLLSADSSFAVSGDVSKINQYTLIVDGTKLAESKVDVLAYLNGTAMGKTTEIATAKTVIQNEFQYCPRGKNINTYALRVYNKVLSADEALQNHFADIAIFNRLNVREFKALDDAKKPAVYAVFASMTIDSASTEEFQTMLDEAVTAAKSAE